MKVKKFSTLILVSCLVSGLSLSFSKSAQAGFFSNQVHSIRDGFRNVAPPSMPEPPSGYKSNLNLPNFDNRNVGSCAYYYSNVVDTSNGGTSNVLSCSEKARDIIANSYCNKKGSSGSSYWKILDGDRSTRVQAWILSLTDSPNSVNSKPKVWTSQPADSYFTQINCR
ncbi:MAG: hypothetical protein HCA25_22585 [Dolichospermum sp. DET50]|nr:hypothetical protein [Dolichospermum sp. DET66]MBS3034957.1 hypothetical protein [Dolichospermum sp. DET67]MBS3040158.1 hypothetical protein [Dolichospermum sp. DET50]QSX67332.1 MAG: hypothetical protein EZY12_21855 [Dolichospermum sp. DET69]